MRSEERRVGEGGGGGGGGEPVTSEKRAEIRAMTGRLNEDGLRVLIVAVRRDPTGDRAYEIGRAACRGGGGRGGRGGADDVGEAGRDPRHDRPPQRGRPACAYRRRASRSHGRPRL